MTPAQIATEYLRREAEGNQTTQGADPKSIIAQMSEEYSLSWSDIRQAVLDETILDAN